MKNIKILGIILGASLVVSGVFISLRTPSGLIAKAGSYSFPITGGTGTSTAPIYGQMLVGNAGGTYTLTATSSLGIASAATMTTVIDRSIIATGVVSGSSLTSSTTYPTGLFTVPESIIVNQVTYNVSTLGTGGPVRICIYSESGQTKLVDVSSSTVSGVNSITVSPAVSLSPGNYYIAMGCAGSCDASFAVSKWTTNAASWINGASVPSGKKVWEGNATMAAGTCNATLPSLTGGNSLVPVVRLDN